MLAIPDFGPRSDSSPQLLAGATLQEIFNQLHVGVYQISLTGVLLKVNSTLCQWLGYNWQDLVDRHLETLNHPDDLGDLLQGYSDLVGGRISSLSLEKRYLHRDGQSLWMRVTLSLVRDAAGEPQFSL